MEQAREMGNEKSDREGKITVWKVENPTAARNCETLQPLRISQNRCPSEESSCQDRNLFTMEKNLQSFNLNTEELRSKGQEVICDHHKN